MARVKRHLPEAIPAEVSRREPSSEPPPLFPKAPRLPSGIGTAVLAERRGAPAPEGSSPVVLVSAVPEPKSGWIVRRGVLGATFVVCFLGVACVVGLVLTTDRRVRLARDTQAPLRRAPTEAPHVVSAVPSALTRPAGVPLRSGESSLAPTLSPPDSKHERSPDPR
ncbi:MAG: hypothetical protein M3O50_15720 [Myxococcota bacterium]|nr:hypothetical protein [Myxococcota bacterium]